MNIKVRAVRVTKSYVKPDGTKVALDYDIQFEHGLNLNEKTFLDFEREITSIPNSVEGVKSQER
jgi:hypothetical protein